MIALERWLRRVGALTAGVLSALVIWWVWDQAAPVPVVHDEASYLLQAELFARGQWSAPAPPIPEFFEQPHVQVEPVVASKYPPGHALLLSLGVMVGFPALIPLLLTAVTGALLFSLVTRLANPWVAAFSWAVWLFAPIVLRFQPSYLSELTTTPLVLASWWALLEWRESARPRWMILLALFVGWGAITRPLTMLVFAIPIGVVVVRDASRFGLWRDLGLGVLTGVLVLAILPLWSAKTTGHAGVNPVEKYRLDYLPYDKMGFVADTTPPRRRASMSPVLVETYYYFLTAKREQTLGAAPLTVLRRVLALTTSLFYRERLPLLLLAIVGLFVMTPPLRFAVGSSVLLLLAHLPYAHWPGWNVYYLETAPVAAALVGAGMWYLARRFAGPERAPRVAVAALLLVLMAGAFGAREWRSWHRGPSGGQLHRQLAQLIARLPRPAILFVRYSPRLAHNPAVVRNSPDLARDSMWVVHDLGARNAELRALAPERATHFLDVDRMVRSAR